MAGTGPEPSMIGRTNEGAVEVSEEFAHDATANMRMIDAIYEAAWVATAPDLTGYSGATQRPISSRS